MAALPVQLPFVLQQRTWAKVITASGTKLVD